MKTVTKPCERCGLDVEVSPHARFCPECRVEHERNYKAMYYQLHKERVKALSRERWQQIKADPAQSAEHRRRQATKRRQQRQDPETRAKFNEATRRYRERLKKKRPKVYQQQLEDARIRMKLRNEKRGRTLKVVSVEDYEKSFGPLHGGPRVPAAPLVPYIDRWLEFSQADMHIAVSMTKGQKDQLPLAGQGVLADLAGISSRRIYAIRSGEQEQVTLDTADRLCVALGVPLSLVYEEEAAA